MKKITLAILLCIFALAYVSANGEQEVPEPTPLVGPIISPPSPTSAIMPNSNPPAIFTIRLYSGNDNGEANGNYQLELGSRGRPIRIIFTSFVGGEGLASGKTRIKTWNATRNDGSSNGVKIDRVESTECFIIFSEVGTYYVTAISETWGMSATILVTTVMPPPPAPKAGPRK